MIKDFIPYAEALELKELGFDEPCFGRYQNTRDLLISHTERYVISNGVDRSEFFTLAPLYQQVFRWFREKYGYLASPFSIKSKEGNMIYCFELSKVDKFIGDIYSDDKSTYEEAKLACLNKLIEIVKNK